MYAAIIPGRVLRADAIVPPAPKVSKAVIVIPTVALTQAAGIGVGTGGFSAATIVGRVLRADAIVPPALKVSKAVIVIPTDALTQGAGIGFGTCAFSAAVVSSRVSPAIFGRPPIRAAIVVSADEAPSTAAVAATKALAQAT